jgi:hypothetical protein
MRLHIGAISTDNGGWMSAGIMDNELGLSIEPEMKQVHGNIPATRFTRRIKFGFGWESRDTHPAGARLWVHGHRASYESHPTRVAWILYWSRYNGLSFDNYLLREFRAETTPAAVPC